MPIYSGEKAFSSFYKNYKDNPREVNFNDYRKIILI